MENVKRTDESARWDLSPYFEGIDSENYRNDMKTIEKSCKVFSDKWRPSFGSQDSPKSPKSTNFKELLNEYDGLIGKISILHSFIYCLNSAHTDSQIYQSELAKIIDLWSRCQNILLFVELGIKNLSEKDVNALMESSDLSEYRYFIKSLRVTKPYTLSEGEEKLVSIKNVTGKGAWVRYFDQFTASFKYNISEISPNELSESEVRAARYSPDRNVRKAATEALGEKYKENSQLLTPIFNHIFKDHISECELRGYSAPMEPVNLHNDLSDDIVETMMRVTEEHYHLAQRYFELKGKYLGFTPLESWDVSAPFQTNNKKIPWSEAKKHVIEAYEMFDPEFGELVKGFFDKNYIEAENRPNKRGGAYCTGFGSGCDPRVFMTYTGSPRDLSTIAHEFGHAVHFKLASVQKNINYNAILPMAETASVFGEMLLTKKFLSKETDNDVRRQILASKIEDMIATVFNQNAYVRFEQAAYKKRIDGELATNQFGEIWMEESKKLYGDSVKLLQNSMYTWQGIPHFIHTRFYCYAYTFGELLSIALYGLYEDNPNPQFNKDFKTLLSHGSSDKPEVLLKPFGIDLSDSKFWEQGFKIIKKFIDDFEETLS